MPSSKNAKNGSTSATVEDLTVPPQKAQQANPEKPRMKMNKTLVIIGVVGAILLIGGTVFILWQGGYFNVDSNTEESESTTTTTLAPNDLALEDSISIPDYTASSSNEILSQMLTEAQAWSSDAKIRGITASTTYMQSNQEKLYFGQEEGSFSSWTINVFSPTLKQTMIVSANNGEIERHPANDLPENISEAMERLASYNDISTIISSNDVYDVLTENGLDEESNYYNLYLGERVTSEDSGYEGGYIWMAEERSKTEAGSDNQGSLVTTYFIDGISGELLEKN